MNLVADFGVWGIESTDAFDALHNLGLVYSSALDEQASLEQIEATYGGLGGWQTSPFLMYPVDLPAPQEPIVGAAGVHAVLKGWAGRQAP